MPHKTLLIYKSNTGFTQRYANWISEELPCDLVPYKKRNTVNLTEYDTIIFGSRLHAGAFPGLKWFKQQLPALQGKKLVAFATGATPPENPVAEETVRRNFTDEEFSKIKTFYFHSGLCYEKMGLVDKIMMAGLRTMLKKDPSQAEMLASIQHSSDFSSKDFIIPLVSYCRAPG